MNDEKVPCLACSAEDAENKPQAWIVGCAAGARASTTGGPLVLCSVHAHLFVHVSEIMGAQTSAIKPQASEVTLNCFVTEDEMVRLQKKQMTSGMEGAILEVLGDAAWKRVQGHTVGFLVCETPSEDRFEPKTRMDS
jgi:hypothetical protein